MFLEVLKNLCFVFFIAIVLHIALFIHGITSGKIDSDSEDSDIN